MEGSTEARWRLFPAVLGAFGFVILVPWQPTLPHWGLDPSHALAFAYAAHRDFSLVTDIVWTYGPLGVLVYKLAWPGDHLWILPAQALFCALLIVGGWRTIRIAIASPTYRLLAFFIYLVLIRPGFELIPILVFLEYFVQARRSTLFLWLGACACVILGLAKSTYFFLSLPVFAVIAAAEITRRRVPTVTLLYLATFLVLWVAVGEPIQSLPLLVWNYAEHSRAFQEMPIPGLWLDIFAFLIPAGLLLWITRPRSCNGAPVWLGTLGLLFLAFKAGFVRHDAHVLLSSAVLGVLLLGQLGSPWPRLSPLLKMVIVASWALLWLGPAHRYEDDNLLRSRYGAAARGVSQFVQMIRAPSSYADRFEQSLGEIRERFPLAFRPPANATADFLQHDQAILIAHGVRYTPRPVFQSYAVGTPALARRNLAFYTSSSAPDYVLMTVRAIDGRLPSLEDGLLWPVLLESYSAKVLEDGGEMLWLERRETPPPPPVLEELGWKKRFDFAEVVELPDHGEPLWAKLTLDRTWLGRVMGFVFRHPVVRIHRLLDPDPSRLRYFDEEFYGQKHARRIARKILGFWRRYDTAEKHYSTRGKLRGFAPNPYVRVQRLMPSVSGLGFLISPYVEDAEDFYNLHRRDREYLDESAVHAIEIQLAPRWGWASSLLFDDPVLELFTLR